MHQPLELSAIADPDFSNINGGSCNLNTLKRIGSDWYYNALLINDNSNGVIRKSACNQKRVNVFEQCFIDFWGECDFGIDIITQVNGLRMKLQGECRLKVGGFDIDCERAAELRNFAINAGI